MRSPAGGMAWATSPAPISGSASLGGSGPREGRMETVGATQARSVPAFHTRPPHFPVNCEPLLPLLPGGRKHWSSQSPGRRPLLGSWPRPAPEASRRAPATHRPTQCPAPVPCPAPRPHPHLARRADDGLEKLPHLVKPGLDVTHPAPCPSARTPTLRGMLMMALRSFSTSLSLVSMSWASLMAISPGVEAERPPSEEQTRTWAPK